MRIIPKSTKNRTGFIGNLSLSDCIIGLILFCFVGLIVASNLQNNWLYAMIVVMMSVGSYLPIDGSDKVYNIIYYGIIFLTQKKRFSKQKTKGYGSINDIVPFTGFKDECIDYNGEYYGKVIEITPSEFALLSEYNQNSLINAVANAFQLATEGQRLQLVKIDKPLILDSYSKRTVERIKELEESGLSEVELESRREVLKGRLAVIDNLNNLNRLYQPSFFLVLYDKTLQNTKDTAEQIISVLNQGGIIAQGCNEKETAVFLKYSYARNFDERKIDDLSREQYIDWIKPKKIEFTRYGCKVDDIQSYSFAISDYPLKVANAWGAELCSLPNTKVVLNITPIEKDKAVKRVDKGTTNILMSADKQHKLSQINDTQVQLETMRLLVEQLNNDNEALYDCNVYITAYNYENENNSALKKSTKRLIRQGGYSVSDLSFRQLEGYISAGLSMREKIKSYTRGIQGSSIAAFYPFVTTEIMDEDGFPLGHNDWPAFIDFFKRDKIHVNSNLMCVGKTGGGKSYGGKTLLANLATYDCKMFAFDPDGEYTRLARQLGGKVVDVGTATEGRLNPFHMTYMLREEIEDGDAVSRADNKASYYNYLRFLEEFFRVILEGVSSDALELLNNLTVELYLNKGITENTDISKLKPTDFPIFDDLLTLIRKKISQHKTDTTKHEMLLQLELYIAKFALGGRNSDLWNGASSIDLKERFIVFNFQSLLANKNNLIANAQMLLVLKYLDNELIAMRDYNIINKTKRRIIILVDEAHVFIDQRRPVALDFLKDTAKRIRKYFGMLIVITQSIRDFIGTSPEIASKAGAVISACQYSLFFGLSDADMHDLVALYSKSTPLNEVEQAQIAGNTQGKAFFITSPQNRSNITIVATEAIKKLFITESIT